MTRFVVADCFHCGATPFADAETRATWTTRHRDRFQHDVTWATEYLIPDTGWDREPAGDDPWDLDGITGSLWPGPGWLLTVARYAYDTPLRLIALHPGDMAALVSRPWMAAVALEPSPEGAVVALLGCRLAQTPAVTRGRVWVIEPNPR